jgi:aminopeptidase N
MLRNYVGDEAFFLSLKHYLDKKRFGTGESHDLRLSFEEVTGEDMNWFFNQWYFDKGHPTLNFSQKYDEVTKKLTVTVEQKQDLEKFPVFQLPIGIDIYTKGGIERKKITVTKTNQSFDFYTETPLLVNIDADKVLLCKKTEEKPMEQWIYQLNNAPLYLDKKEAFVKVKNSKDTSYVNAVFSMLEQPHPDFNNMAMGKLSELKKQQPIKLKASLLKLTKNKKSSVRAKAYKNLEGYFGEDTGHEKLLTEGLNDKSYKVIGVCLGALANSNPDKAMEVAKDLEKEKSNSVSSVLASLYADHGTKENHDFFKTAISNAGGFSKYGLLNQYSTYLGKLDDKDISDSYEVYEGVITTSSTWWIKMGGYQGLMAGKNRMTNRISELNTELGTVSDVMKKSKIEREINDYKTEIDKIDAVYNKSKSIEKDSKVLEYLKNM